MGNELLTRCMIHAFPRRQILGVEMVGLANLLSMGLRVWKGEFRGYQSSPWQSFPRALFFIFQKIKNKKSTCYFLKLKNQIFQFFLFIQKFIINNK